MWERIKEFCSAHSTAIKRTLAIVFLLIVVVVIAVGCSSLSDVETAQFGFTNSVTKEVGCV